MTVPLDFFFFFFNDTATTEIYTLSLHDALPISPWRRRADPFRAASSTRSRLQPRTRSEEHTSELQSLRHLVCRLLLEKKTTKVRRLTISDLASSVCGRVRSTDLH